MVVIYLMKSIIPDDKKHEEQLQGENKFPFGKSK